jgi:hypothetical protein
MKDFKVKVFDGTERAETFMEVFGRTEVCVLSPLPVLVNVPGFDAPQAAYMLDLQEITDDECDRLVAHISKRFVIDAHEVSSLLEQHGVPILLAECTLTIENPQKWIDFNDAPVEDRGDFDEDFDEDFEY